MSYSTLIFREYQDKSSSSKKVRFNNTVYLNVPAQRVIPPVRKPRSILKQSKESGE